MSFLSPRPDRVDPYAPTAPAATTAPPVYPSHTHVTHHDGDGMDWLRAALGVLGLFLALGIATAILAFSAANALKGVNLSDPDQSGIAGAALVVGLLPLVAGPILATLGGLWAGTRTRDAGEGALGGAVGSLVGILALAILTAIGFALGANAAGVDLTHVAWPSALYVRPGWNSTLGYLGTGAGILYLVASLLAAAIAGAIAGSLMGRDVLADATRRTDRDHRRMPRV